MSAHPRTRRYRSFEIDIAVLLEGTKVCPSQGFGRYADFERVFVEGSHGKAGTVYTDAVTESAVSEDFGCVRDGECCTPIFRLGIELGGDL